MTYDFYNIVQHLRLDKWMTFTFLYHILDCRTDQCDCKENVEGRQCDRCKGGFFGLLPNHPNGCLSCW